MHALHYDSGGLVIQDGLTVWISISTVHLPGRCSSAVTCGMTRWLVGVLVGVVNCSTNAVAPSKYECTYLTPGDSVPTGVHTYNGSMLVHSSLALPLSVSFHIVNTSALNGSRRGNESGLRGAYHVPAIFDEPCKVFNASCDTVSSDGSYWNTNFSLQEPDQTGSPGRGGRVVRVVGNYLPCVAGGGTFRLKGVLHMLSRGMLRDEFCIGHCCGS